MARRSTLITSSNTGCAMTLKSDQFSPHNSARKRNLSRRVRKPQQIVTSSLTFVQSGYISISASPTGVCKHNPRSENRNTCGSFFFFFVCSSLRIVNYALARPQSSRPATLRGPALGLVGRGAGADYGGLKAPIDGQMNQQGPPNSFIHSPNGPFYRSCSWTPLT